MRLLSHPVFLMTLLAFGLSACSKESPAPVSDAASSQVKGPVLTAERMIGSPDINGPSLHSPKLSPDGARVTYLHGKPDNKRQLDLWEYNVAAGETRVLVDSDDLLNGQTEVLSEEEKARRQRQRIKNSGIIDYFWNEQGTVLLFPLGGDIYIKPLDGAVKRLTNTASFETDIKFSPNGGYVSFIRDRDLFVVNVATGREQRLTTGANADIAHGVADFAAQEELSRFTGYWWSPDETQVAFTRIDESPVGVFDRYELKSDGSVTTLKQRYPAAGTPNAIVELGVVKIASGEIRWIDLGENKDIYLARVNWMEDNRHLTFQRLQRNQQTLELMSADMQTGQQTRLLVEESDVWINLHKDFYSLENSAHFVWSSERSGFRHLYLYNNDGTEVGALTAGDWVVSKIVNVDEAENKVYFLGFKDNTFERHLYSASLQGDPDSITRVSQQVGWHKVEMGDDRSLYLDTFSSQDVPPQLALRKVKDDQLVSYINANPLDKTHPYFQYLGGHSRSEFGQILAADGVTKLDYRLLLPPEMKAGEKYPAILAPYGGPHGHRVQNNFHVDINQLLSRNGFVVMIVDGRGSYDRGQAFEAGIKHAMGTVEVEDQIAAAKFLQAQDYINPERIGFHGWSYGGYMALMMMAKAPDLIKVGFAGAPVTDWRLYDTAYTERYLGMPDAPGEVYENSSVFKYLPGIKGKLMLVHGMADDNVFFDHSVKLIAAMQKNGVQFDLMTYPGQKHSFIGEDVKIHLANLQVSYFLEHL